MSFTLLDHRYGKARLRLVRVDRDSARHGLHDVEVDVRLAGGPTTTYETGDNREVLPTDTMKNTVYALARQLGVGEIEDFGLALARHFLQRAPGIEAVHVELSERLWERIAVAGEAHDHAFAEAGRARRTARIELSADELTIEAGIADLRVLKTTGSAFVDFLRDEYTTLPDSRDRIFATIVEARWRYAGEREDFAPGNRAYGRLWHAVRDDLTATFATHESYSVQQTLYAMGEAVLARHLEIDEIRLTLPNQHHLLMNLAPFHLDNPNLVFIATDEPHGVIEGTMRRG